MRRILSWRMHPYIGRVGIVLIAIALILGTVSCAGGGVTKYSLTMAVNPAGGGTATDLINASPYAAGTVVNIQAVAAPPYQFITWGAPAGTFGNATAAATTFTMPAQNVTVTANFAGPQDHSMGYGLNTTWYIGENVTLEDEFGAVNATVQLATGFCNPADKVHDGNLTHIWDPDHHIVVYTLDCPVNSWWVEVKNQFGTFNLTVSGPVKLVVPTQKVEPGNHNPPVGLDHCLLYNVTNYVLVNEYVDLHDEFGNQTNVNVHHAVYFGNPVKKTHDGGVTEILNPDRHMVGYYIIYGGYVAPTTVQVVNQFGARALNVSDLYVLGVPSAKLSWGPIL